MTLSCAVQGAPCAAWTLPWLAGNRVPLSLAFAQHRNETETSPLQALPGCSPSCPTWPDRARSKRNRDTSPRLPTGTHRVRVRKAAGGLWRRACLALGDCCPSRFGGSCHLEAVLASSSVCSCRCRRVSAVPDEQLPRLITLTTGLSDWVVGQYSITPTVHLAVSLHAGEGTEPQLSQTRPAICLVSM